MVCTKEIPGLISFRMDWLEKTEARGLSKVKLSQIKAFVREALVGRMNQDQPGPRGQKGLGNGVGQGELVTGCCLHPQEAVEGPRVTMI